MFKISVIIPIYNLGNLLNECIYSVAEQSIGIEYIQIICVNDASPLKEEELNIQKYWFERYPNNFTIIHNTENLGLGFTRNKGMKFVKGEYVHFLDGDDTIEPNLYLDAYQQLKKYKADLFRLNYYRHPFYKKKHYTGNTSREGIMSNNDKTRALFYSYAWMNIINTKLLKKMKHFSKGIYEDMPSTPTLFKQYHIKYYQSSKAYYYYRINPSSITQIAKQNKSLRDDIKIKYLFDSLNDFVDKSYFKLHYGYLIAQFFVIYMTSFSSETLMNFKNTMHTLKEWSTKNPKQQIKFHPDTVKDFGKKISLINQILLIFWKLGFYEILFFIRKFILFIRKNIKD